MICSTCNTKVKRLHDPLVAIEMLMRLLGGFDPEQAKISSESMVEWLKSLQAEHGFRDYFRYRDLQILKTMANGLTPEQYWMNCGRRAELLYMISKSTELIKRKKQEEELARIKAEANNEST